MLHVLVWTKPPKHPDPPGLHYTTHTAIMASEFYQFDLAPNDPKLTWLNLISEEVIDYIRTNSYELYDYFFIVDYCQHNTVLQRWAQDSESS